MTNKEAIQRISAIINQVKGNYTKPTHKRNNGLDKQVMTFTISRITKPRLTPNAIHYQDCKKTLYYHDYHSEDEKATIETILNRLKSYSGETSLSLQVFNQANPKPVWIHCYSAKKLSDNATDNEADYVFNHFSEGNVVKIKMLNHTLFTKVIKLRDNEAATV